MSYTFTVQGVKCVSNYPPNTPPQSGAKYQVDMKLTIPFANYLLKIGFDEAQFLAQVTAKLQGHNVQHFTTSTPDANTLRLEFTADSPPPVLVAVALVGGISIVILAFINQITIAIDATVKDVAAAIGPVGQFGLGILVLGLGVAVLAFVAMNFKWISDGVKYLGGKAKTSISKDQGEKVAETDTEPGGY